jgi:hypothetical protein
MTNLTHQTIIRPGINLHHAWLPMLCWKMCSLARCEFCWQVWRLTEGWRDSQHMLGSYLGSPWSSAGTALAALRLPQHADTLAPGDKIQIGVFRHDKGTMRSLHTLVNLAATPTMPAQRMLPLCAGAIFS